MKRLLLTLACSALLCGAARAAEPAYRTECDIAYRSEAPDAYAAERCLLDLYLPTGAEGFATVIWYHGGGLTGGHKEIPAALREKGFAVAGINYRLARPRRPLGWCGTSPNTEATRRRSSWRAIRPAATSPQ